MSSNPPNKILLVRFSALGDVIQTLPILSMLREAYPDAKIGWAIDRDLVPAIEGHPCLDYIHPCDRKLWGRSLTNPLAWKGVVREASAFLSELKAIDYDVAIDVQGLFKTALLTYLAGIKRRVGYGHGRELSSFFYTEKYMNLKEYFAPEVFHLEHMELLAKAVGGGEVKKTIQAPIVPELAKEKVRKLIGEALLDTTRPLVAMAPATQWESKHWPEEYWVALIDDLLTKTDANIALVGSRGDAALAGKIIQAFPQSVTTGRVLDLSGKTNVREMYAFYEHVHAAIGSDSAPLHIAGAVRVPILIGIYGPTAYRRTPPIGSEHITLLSTEIDAKLPCQPCHKKSCPLGTTECMNSITPDAVFAALQESIHKTAAAVAAR